MFERFGEDREQLVFLNDKNTAYDVYYEPQVMDDQLSIEPFPLPDDEDTYETYQKKARAWGVEVLRRLDGRIPPLLTTDNYKRPPPPMSKEDFRTQRFNPEKSKLNGSNLYELLKIVTTQDLIPDKDQVFEAPAVGPKHVKISNHLFEDAWDQPLYPMQPLPQLYDTYEDYKYALLNWVKVNSNKKAPQHPRELKIYKPEENGQMFEYKEIDERPKSRFLDFLKSGVYGDIPLAYLHEIYIRKFLYPYKTRRRQSWYDDLKYALNFEKTSQNDELYILIGKRIEDVNEMIEFGPQTVVENPHPFDYSEVGKKFDTDSTPINTKEDLIFKAILPDYSLKSTQIAIERNASLFTGSEAIKMLVMLCKDCTADLPAKKLAFLITSCVFSPGKGRNLDIILNNRDYMKELCLFAGKFGFIPKSAAICYNLPLETDVSFKDSYTLLVLSGLMYCLSLFAVNEVPDLSNRMTKHFHATAEIIQFEMKTIISAFSENEYSQEVAYSLIILALSIPYRPFHCAIFSPSPINTLYELLKSNFPKTEERVLRIVQIFETGPGIRSVLPDLIQFDVKSVSRKADFLVPIAKRLLDTLSRTKFPIITRTQLMAQTRSFTIKLEPSCYLILESIANIFSNKKILFGYKEEDLIADKTFVVTMIVKFILQSETKIIDSLFNSLKKLIFKATWEFPKQFWMVFVATLWSENPVAYNCWDFLLRVFELSLNPILPEFFEDQITSIFKPANYEYCCQIYRFLNKIVLMPEITIMEQWFINKEALLRHNFEEIFMIIQRQEDKREFLYLYKQIMNCKVDTSGHKNGWKIFSIIRSSKFEKRILRSKV